MRDLDAQILEDVEPILEGMGYAVVEIRAVIQKSGPKVYVVITKKGGVNIDDTADVLQVLRPRIQILLENQDIYLEVSSPGIDRIFKDSREYRVFVGKGVKILTMENNDWIGGVLEKVEGDAIQLRKNQQQVRIPLAQIKKAKLDYTEEVQSSYGI